jgi:citrate lyase beta subunit
LNSAESALEPDVTEVVPPVEDKVTNVKSDMNAHGPSEVMFVTPRSETTLTRKFMSNKHCKYILIYALISKVAGKLVLLTTHNSTHNCRVPGRPRIEPGLSLIKWKSGGPFFLPLLAYIHTFLGIIIQVQDVSMRRLYRSCLFAPADRPEVLAKAFRLACDVVVLDLEDAVSPTRKEESRGVLLDALKSRDQLLKTNPKYSRQRVIARVNCPHTADWGRDDLRLVSEELSQFIDALVLPKVDSMDALSGSLGILKGNDAQSLPIWAMIESAAGFFAAEAVARHDQCEALVFGSNDMTKDIKGQHTHHREPLLFGMSGTIMAARAAGKAVVDGVHMEFRDVEGLGRACAQGRALGFDGKSLIHPAQVETANRAFSPSPKDLTLARATIAAYDSARAQGKSLAVLDGRLVEALHVEEARQLLALGAYVASGEGVDS